MLRKQAEGRHQSMARLVKHALSWNSLITWGPVVAVIALIYSLSSRSDLGGSGMFMGFLSSHFSDTPLYSTLVPIVTTLDANAALSGHLVEFALLATAVKRAIDRQWPWTHHLFVTFLAAWIFAVTYGILDEWHQSFVIGRHSDPMDVLIDSLGAACALIVLYVLGRNRPRRHLRTHM